MSSNLKIKVAVVAVFLLALIPASVAQSSSVTAIPMCRAGELVGIRMHVTAPGTYTMSIPQDVCDGIEGQPEETVRT